MSDLGYPMIQARDSNFEYGREGYSIIWIIVHCTDNAYADNYPANLGSYWAREDTEVSVHYGVSDSQVYQYVAHADTAYQALNPGNLRGVGMELSGLSSYGRDTWLGHDAMLRNAGKLIGEIGARHGIPVRFLSDDELRGRQAGVTTHAQLTRVFGGTHVDPGSGFPLDVLLSYATGGGEVVEDEMGVLGGQVLSGDAVTVFGVPEVTGDRWVKVSFAADFGTAKLRVATNVGSYWDVREVVVKDSDNRIFAGFDLPEGANKVSVSREDGKDVPVGYLVEFK